MRAGIGIARRSLEMGASSGQGKVGEPLSQIKRADPRGSYLRDPGISYYLRLVAWSGLGEVG